MRDNLAPTTCGTRLLSCRTLFLHDNVAVLHDNEAVKRNPASCCFVAVAQGRHAHTSLYLLRSSARSRIQMMARWFPPDFFTGSHPHTSSSLIDRSWCVPVRRSNCSTRGLAPIFALSAFSITSNLIFSNSSILSPSFCD